MQARRCFAGSPGQLVAAETWALVMPARPAGAALLQVLDASRRYQRARLGYARAAAQRYLDPAQLFLAMGGGWWH